MNSVPGAFVDEIDNDTYRVGYDDEHDSFSGTTRDCVRNDRVYKDTEDTVGDSLKD